jgi:serine/threonine protein kinase
MIGKTILHYKILEKLGEGGMGVVYKAEDTRLKRTVALKFLPPHLTGNTEAQQRFMHEAQAASALDHSNICTIHEIGKAKNGQVFIVMAYYEGATLKETMQDRAFTTEEALEIAVQISRGLKRAHEAGIVHRDIKPANIFITSHGDVKILDFGLAKLTGQTKITRTGTTLGTVAYMSPEQAGGKEVDARTDVWSLGVILYEMMTGELPFKGDYEQAVIYSILNDSPTSIKALRPEIPERFHAIVEHALEKKPESRLSGVRILDELEAFRTVLSKPSGAVTFDIRSVLQKIRRPGFAIPAAVVILMIGLFTARSLIRSRRIHWARYRALPEIHRLIGEFRVFDAFLLAMEAKRSIPDDPQMIKLWNTMITPHPVQSDPPGVDVYFNDYTAVDSGWLYFGRTPIDGAELPRAYMRMRGVKGGYETADYAGFYWRGDTIRISLVQKGAGPPGMIRVPEGQYELSNGQSVELPEFWIDKYEVTNQDYKKFVDAGGYQKEAYWKHPIVKDGRSLSWKAAMEAFRDITGRPGPATWRLGTYPEGQAEYPVRGISWYEAAAYAEFAGKSLPTVFHWRKAAGFDVWARILALSNFKGEGPAKTGTFKGMTRYGVYDMAGNVKEWCWNRSGRMRYVLGGCWDEPEYMFSGRDCRPPFARDETVGFRCVRYTVPLSEDLTRPIVMLYRDMSREKPVEDRIFEIYRSLYSYDRTDLDTKIESVDESLDYWRRETVSFKAAYGDERVVAHLNLPRNTQPPYQAVIYFPGISARYMKSSENLVEMMYTGFIPRSGRALLYPVYKGTYERGGGDPIGGMQAHRDQWIMRCKDLRRCVDFLETREDIDAEKIAYMGLSWGAENGPIFTAIDDRFKASVLIAGCLAEYFMRRPPEVNPLHFGARSRVPVLLINGRFDFDAPVETSIIPMFRLQGAPEQDKRLTLLHCGHVPPMDDIIRETLDWLDRYLGPVK